MVSADPCCVAPAISSLLDHCVHSHHNYHGLASVEFLLEKSSSSSSSSDSSSPLPVPPRNKVSRSREITSRYKSPVPSPARYKSPPPSSFLSSSSVRRFASPSVDRTYLDASASSKRAISAERHRPSPTRTGLESRLFSAANGDGCTSALPPRRTTTRSDLLWPTTKSLYSSIQAEPSPSSVRSPEKTRPDSKGRSSSNLVSDHALKPSPNAAQKLSDQCKKTPERKGTPRCHSLGQSENARPPEITHPKLEPVLKHRWPSSLSILKLYSTATSKSADLTSDRERLSGRARPMNMLHSRPTSFSSQVIPRVLPNTSGVFSHTINDGASSVIRSAARKLSLENKPRVSSPVKPRRGTPARDDSYVTSVTTSRSGSSLDLVRQLEESAELASEEYSAVDKSSEITQVGTKTTSMIGSPTSTVPDFSTGRSRASLDAYRLNISSPDCGYVKAAGGKQLATRQRLTPSSETRADYSTVSPWPGYKPSIQGSLSPVKLHPVSSALKSWPSPTGSRVSSLTYLSSTSTASRSNGYSSVLHFGSDSRKSRKGLSQVEATYLHCILHNRLLQWQFANARADVANSTHRQAGEKLLFSVWAKTVEIRKSVTSKRIRLQQARQAHKLNTILRIQGSKLDEWSTFEQDHSNALSGAVEALEDTVLRVPVNEGIKADTQAVKEAITSAVDLVHAVESSAGCLLPKMDKTNTLMSELAQVADEERTLLEECGDLLVAASSLEAEERSLRMQLLQLEQEKARVLGHLMASGNGTNSCSI